LSLLGKSFWTYPMAKSGRTSLFLIENDAFNTSCLEDNTKTSDSSIEKIKVIKTPPIAPRKFSLGSNSSPPVAKVRSRRSSDSVSFITSPTVSPYRNSLVNMANVRKPDKEGDAWISSPVFANYTAGSRQRKVSVFDGNLGPVKEIHEHDKGDNEALYEEVTEHKLPIVFDNSNICHNSDDYACPVDAVREDVEQNIYEAPMMQCENSSSAPSTVISIRKHRFSDSNMRYGGDVNNKSDNHHLTEYSHQHQRKFQRKFSLGVMWRKISAGSLQAGKRKTSLQERRLSNAFTKLINFPTTITNSLVESYQVDSSSWEFLNKDTRDFCLNDSHDITNDHHKRELKNNKHPSKDSVYESEYDSSSTLGSSSSSTSKALFTA